MTEKDIPAEILLQIAIHLTPDDKRKGLTICRDWYETFRYSLYSEITVNDPCQLKSLFESLSYSNQRTNSEQTIAIIPNGHFVQKFTTCKSVNLCSQTMIQRRVIIPQTLFEQLPDLCPNLKTLEFDPDTWKFIHYHSNVAKWKRSMRHLPPLADIGTSMPFLECLGRGLSSLTLQTGIILDVSTQYRLSALLSLVPHITELTIQGDTDHYSTKSTSLSFMIEDIELIHKLLPRLISFTIIGDDIQMPIEAASTSLLDRVEKFATNSQLKKLHWNASLIPMAWIIYVTHKYPHVIDITLAMQISQQDHIFAENDENSLMCCQLLRKCSHLEKISISCPELNDWFNASFFKILADLTNVKEIIPIVKKGNQIKYDQQLKLAIQSGNSGLFTTLEIEQWRLDEKLPITLNLLKNFTKLTYLELKCDSYHDEYNIETLLDTCPNLKTLILEWGSILSPVNYANVTTETIKHPLETLDITYVAFTPYVFRYLSGRCRSLSKLLVTKCKQLCEMEHPTTQTVVQFDMPHNDVELIVMDGLRLDYSNAFMFYTGASGYIRIAAFKQDKDTEEKWYQNVGYTARDRKVPVVKLLDQNETEVANKYFTKRKRCTFVNCPEYLKTLNEEAISNSLGSSLLFGVVHVRCKTLKSFVLDGNVSS